MKGHKSLGIVIKLGKKQPKFPSPLCLPPNHQMTNRVPSRNKFHCGREDVPATPVQSLSHRRNGAPTTAGWPPRRHRLVWRHRRRAASHGQGETPQAPRSAAGACCHWPVPPDGHLGQSLPAPEAAGGPDFVDEKRYSGCKYANNKTDRPTYRGVSRGLTG